MRKHKNRDEEIEQNKNIILIKFNSINLIHQANANQIIIVTTNDVQSVKVQSNALKIIQSNQSLNVWDHKLGWKIIQKICD